MATKTLEFDKHLLAYAASQNSDEHPALEGLRLATAKLEDAHMQSAPEQMSLIALLLKVMQAKAVLEVGCFTGYGALAMALALPSTGRVTTLDVNDQWAAIGRPFWHEAGVDRQIDFRSGLALTSMQELHTSGQSFDFIYIDADKKTYPAYFEAALDLIKLGGTIALDNMLWGGAVADPSNQSRQVQALREVAARIRGDQKLSSCFVPLGDGLMLARKEA